MKKIIVTILLCLSVGALSVITPTAVFEPNKIREINIDDLKFLHAVELGMIDGVSSIRKFSFIEKIDLATVEREIWDYGATDKGNRDYIYPADGTAPIDSVSSSNDTDNQLIRVFGLDIDGYDTIQDITLDGQTRVPIPISLWRVYRVQNIASSSGADRSDGFTGDIYVYENTAIEGGIPVDTTKVRAYVYDGNNSTLMSHYTVPAGKIGLLLGGETRIVKKGVASVISNVYLRNFGSVFLKSEVLSLNSQGSGSITVGLFSPFLMQPKTDIVATADADANAVGVSSNFTILLFDINRWK